MARERMVTRTIKTTKVVCMAVDTELCEIQTIDFTLISATEKNLEKKCIDECEKRCLKFIKIVDTQVDSKLFGMTEEEFITHAVEMEIK